MDSYRCCYLPSLPEFKSNSQCDVIAGFFLSRSEDLDIEYALIIATGLNIQYETFRSFTRSRRHKWKEISEALYKLKMESLGPLANLAALFK